MNITKCKQCGKEIKEKSSRRWAFCSEECYLKPRYGDVEYKCAECGKPFIDFPADDRKYCSRECFYRARKGVDGRVERLCVVCGKPFKSYPSQDRKYCSPECGSKSRVGTIQSKETRIKRSLSERGNKHYNWQGGKTKESQAIRTGIEYRLWRESVFARDNWTCQGCGERGCMLNAHHIKPFAEHPELRTSIENGVTLCKECHQKQHPDINLNIGGNI